MLYSRRQLGRLALAAAALPAAGLLPSFNLARAAEGKPNSRVNGVQIGLNVPYNFRNNNMAGEETLQRVLQLGVSAVELRSQPVELFMGIPAAGGRGGARGGTTGTSLPGLNPEQQAAFEQMTNSFATLAQTAANVRGELTALVFRAEPPTRAELAAKNEVLAQAEAALANARAEAMAQLQASPNRLTREQWETYVRQSVGIRGTGPGAAATDEVGRWRASVSMEKAREFRQRWNEAGVLIEIVKFDGIFNMPDDVLDYAFTLAKTLGARALSTEISDSADALKRVGQFADKHQLMVGYHGHAATTPAHWEAAFSYAKFNGANVDIGHFIAGNNYSPAEFIKKHPDRITHIHVKDRRLNNGPNTPFGQGDTPIREILRMIRDNRWNIQATIEFEYPVPAGSDGMAEQAKAIQYCRDALA